MRAHIATNIIGSFAFDNDKKIIEYRLFPKNPEEIARELEKVREGKIIKQEKEIVNIITKKGYTEIECDRELGIAGVICIQRKDNIASETLQSEYRRLAVDLKWVSSQAELNEILTKVNVILTREKLKTVKSDKIVMNTIGVIDEIDRVSNVFSERLREWYGLYFPEACKLIQSNEKIVELISEHAKKEDIKDNTISRHIEKSAGMPFSDYDLNSVQEFARSVQGLFKTRKELADYLEKTAKETIPNMSAVAGSLISARMLALSGGLEKISRMPSSTIQLLGSEKALFRHLKDKSSPAPKYGALFAHPYIQNAPKELKGKVARLIAAKLSLAAKIDFFSKEDRGEEMRKVLEEQVKRVIKI